MTPEEFRAAADKYLADAIEEGLRLKDSSVPVTRLIELYQSFDDHERLMADHVLCIWLLSEDPGLRNYAIATINHLKLRSTLDCLEDLVLMLRRRSGVGIREELDVVRDVIERLRLHRTS